VDSRSDLDPAAREVTDSLENVQSGLDDLAPEAVQRVRLFLAERAVKGGSSPADIADLYTSPEIVGDAVATRYLDRQFVHRDVPADWRSLQDRIASALNRLPPGATAIEVLAGLDAADFFAKRERSIFDDPDADADDLAGRIPDRDPRLEDLTREARGAVERLIVQEALANGIAPIRYMELRDALDATGDERGIQYLDLPFERGERPADWDALRQQAGHIRQRMDGRGQDPLDLWQELESQFPELDTTQLLHLMEQRLDSGR
jgi:hypothetical protein